MMEYKGYVAPVDSLSYLFPCPRGKGSSFPSPRLRGGKVRMGGPQRPLPQSPFALSPSKGPGSRGGPPQAPIWTSCMTSHIMCPTQQEVLP